MKGTSMRICNMITRLTAAMASIALAATGRRNLLQRFSPAAALALLFALPARGQDADALLKAMSDFNAVQVIYRAGAPHTDKNGNQLAKYDPQRSFFQIGIWGNPIGQVYGVNYDLKALTDAGFNTMWPWQGKLADQLAAGQQAGLQVVVMHPMAPEDAAQNKDHPAWLGNAWMDEPTGHLWGKDMEGKYQEFLAYKQRINAAAPGRVVFINDVPWVTAPATSWWAKWNTAGDVSCHDNYPSMARKHRSRTIGDEGSRSGIPTTVGLATAVNKEQKPVWLIVGAFSQRTHGAFPFRFATPMELRAQVYAGLIHGATGIIYFCWDTYVCRDGGVMGMAPDPQVQYLEGTPGQPHPTPVKPMEIVEAAALWKAAAFINREIKELTPALLSASAPEAVKYSVKTQGESITETPVRCLLKQHPDGGYVLLTVNLDDAVMKGTFEFPGGLKSVQPLFESRPAFEQKPDQKTFEDMYDPYEVHVYRIMLKP